MERIPVFTLVGLSFIWPVSDKVIATSKADGTPFA